MSILRIPIDYPSWIDDVVDWSRRHASDEDRMRLAVAVARRNVVAATGGPFGAAIFERDSGRIVAVGMNSVVRLANSVLHAETFAFMAAQARLGSYTLAAPGAPVHELFTSCEPCAMCLGATLWSGVKRVVCGATREDVEALGFDEGPVFTESYRYLEERGVEFRRGVLRDDARQVLDSYRERGGVVYNGQMAGPSPR
jgi:tRNA(Arg) A34 adenosine deaminase TadA